MYCVLGARTAAEIVPTSILRSPQEAEAMVVCHFLDALHGKASLAYTQDVIELT